MSAQAGSNYVPVEVPLPPAPDVTFFSDAQWKTFFALADVIVPSIRTSATVKSANDKVISTTEWEAAVSKLSSLIPSSDAPEIATQYLEEDASSNPLFRAYVQRILGDYVHEEGKNGFGLIMNALKYASTSLSKLQKATVDSYERQHPNRIVDTDWFDYTLSSPASDHPGENISRLGLLSATSPSGRLPRLDGHSQEILGNG